MPRDFSTLLWGLKLGAPINLALLAGSFADPIAKAGLEILLPAQILFAVSAFRCLFPVRYKDNVVFHDTPLSSIFLTRLLATFSEVAFIFLFSHVIRVANVAEVGWIDALSWLMLAQVVISQFFVWGAILGKRLILYYYEELGWGVIFIANTVASAYLYSTVDASQAPTFLLLLNLLYGALYLPWQGVHVVTLHRDAAANDRPASERSSITAAELRQGLRDSIHERSRRTDGESWGQLVGLTWMVGYWATLIPLWVHRVMVELAAR